MVISTTKEIVEMDEINYKNQTTPERDKIAKAFRELKWIPVSKHEALLSKIKSLSDKGGTIFEYLPNDMREELKELLGVSP